MRKELKAVRDTSHSGEECGLEIGMEEAAGRLANASRSAGWQGRSAAAGVVGSVIASLCCLPTAAALALGLGLGTVATLGELLAYQRLFQVAGLAFAGLTVWRMLRENSGVCGLSEYHRQRLPLLVMGSFAVSFAVLNVIVIPLLERAS